MTGILDTLRETVALCLIWLATVCLPARAWQAMHLLAAAAGVIGEGGD